MIVSAVTFTVYTVYQNKTLDAATAFTALSLLRRFSDELSRLPEEISSILQIKVSISRIFAFLNEPDISVIDKLEYRDAPIIGFRNGQFSYSKTSFNLITGNIDFPLNKLTAIIGSTGSGKTTLLLALLGEIKTTHGAAFIPDLKSSQVAYCPQTAWLLNSTARDNILFMSEYNQERYRAVIEACALEKDLETLTAGDMTEVFFS